MPGDSPMGLRLRLKASFDISGFSHDTQVLLRAMYGGTHDPEVERMSDGDLLEQVRRDLRVTLGIWTEPQSGQAIPWIPIGSPERSRPQARHVGWSSLVVV